MQGNFDTESYIDFKNGHTKDILDINWRQTESNTNYFCSAGSDNKVFIWSLTQTKPIRELDHPDICSSAIFSRMPLSNVLVSGSCDKVIRLWNLSKGSVSHWQ